MGQSDGGNSSVETSSSQIYLDLYRVDKIHPTHQASFHFKYRVTRIRDYLWRNPTPWDPSPPTCLSLSFLTTRSHRCSNCKAKYPNHWAIPYLADITPAIWPPCINFPSLLNRSQQTCSLYCSQNKPNKSPPKAPLKPFPWGHRVLLSWRANL